MNQHQPGDQAAHKSHNLQQLYVIFILLT